MLVTAAVAAAAAAATGAVTVAVDRKRRSDRRARALAEQRAQVERARVEAEALAARRAAEAEEKAARLKAQASAEIEAWGQQLDQEEARLTSRGEGLDRRAEEFSTREEELQTHFDEFKARRVALKESQEGLKAERKRIEETLERLAGTTRQDTARHIGEEMVQRARLEGRKVLRDQEDIISAVAERRARRLIDLASQRYGMPMPANRLITTVSLPSDKKIRAQLLADDRALLKAITEASEVEFVPTDDEEVLLMQAPDPFTREIGRLSFTRLAKQKRSATKDVARIVKSVDTELHQVARKAGKRAARLLKLQPLHPEIGELVGKLLYRTSYTQNQWQHAIETAFLCGMMAEELGLPVKEARRAALLHDIGKVLWAETEAVGSHAVSGAAFARERKEDPAICHAIAAHHDDEKPSTPLAHLVAAADALSGARPGARREMLESFTRRVDDLERISSEFPGVEKAYVIQGGRELRLFVDHRKVNDLDAANLSTEVAHRIEDECIYPGQIKVTVIREIRYSYTAR